MRTNGNGVLLAPFVDGQGGILRNLRGLFLLDINGTSAGAMGRGVVVFIVMTVSTQPLDFPRVFHIDIVLVAAGRLFLATAFGTDFFIGNAFTERF
jgi:hypothetical protein